MCYSTQKIGLSVYVGGEQIEVAVLHTVLHRTNINKSNCFMLNLMRISILL